MLLKQSGPCAIPGASAVPHVLLFVIQHVHFPSSDLPHLASYDYPQDSSRPFDATDDGAKVIAATGVSITLHASRPHASRTVDQTAWIKRETAIKLTLKKVPPFRKSLPTIPLFHEA